MAGFTSRPVLQYEDGIVWLVVRDLVYISEDGTEYTVKAGTYTDFASTPRFLWRVLPPVGVGKSGAYGSAAILHDTLYRTTPHTVSRRKADALFFEAMTSCGVSWWRKWVMYLGVRAFGFISWR